MQSNSLKRLLTFLKDDEYYRKIQWPSVNRGQLKLTAFPRFIAYVYQSKTTINKLNCA